MVLQGLGKGGPDTQPPLIATHAKLLEAETARRNGKLDKAQSLCESLLKQHPNYVGALQTLGAVHLIKKNYWPALSCFTKAAIYCPSDWTNLTNLAAVYVGLGGRELAALTLEQARRLKPDDPEIFATIGEVYREDKEYELAANAFQQALNLDPAHAVAAHGLGESYINLGRYTEAAAAFEKVHRLRPELVGCLYGLTQLPASLVKVDILAALEKVQKSNQQTDEDFRIHVGFTRASAMDRKGQTKEAWGCLVAANRSEWPKHEGDYQKQLIRQETDRNAALGLLPLRKGDRSSSPGDFPSSLFIIGVSRSGKTTLERLVSELKGVKRGYESHLVDRAVQRASQFSGLLTLSRLSDLPKSLDGEFSRLYREEFRAVAGEAKILTNTNPGMIHSAGRVATALPNSRFVFVKRDAHDVAFRIFSKRYKHGNHYAYDLDTVLRYVSWYYEMVDIWLEKIAPVARVVRYEDMIADPHSTLKTVADLCGLPMPEGPLPELGDDRGSAAPYREFMERMLTGAT